MTAKRLVGRVGGTPVQLDHGAPLPIPHVAIHIAAVRAAFGMIAPPRWQSVGAFNVTQVAPLEHGMGTALGIRQDVRQQRAVTVSRAR
ncbi:MAG TPA: hypothetical protein VES60_13800 [Nakamurella sp.]|nr:hypothetical protein [Nakamurella sp.]